MKSKSTQTVNRAPSGADHDQDGRLSARTRRLFPPARDSRAAVSSGRGVLAGGHPVRRARRRGAARSTDDRSSRHKGLGVLPSRWPVTISNRRTLVRNNRGPSGLVENDQGLDARCVHDPCNHSPSSRLIGTSASRAQSLARPWKTREQRLARSDSRTGPRLHLWLPCGPPSRGFAQLAR